MVKRAMTEAPRLLRLKIILLLRLATPIMLVLVPVPVPQRLSVLLPASLLAALPSLGATFITALLLALLLVLWRLIPAIMLSIPMLVQGFAEGSPAEGASSTVTHKETTLEEFTKDLLGSLDIDGDRDDNTCFITMKTGKSVRTMTATSLVRHSLPHLFLTEALRRGRPPHASVT